MDMTDDVNTIKTLLCRLEGDDLEFKRDQYPLHSGNQKAEFIKDVICMANTPRTGAGYIVIGVATKNGRPYEVQGVADHPDPAELQRIVEGRVAPAPRFSYRVVAYDGKEIGLLEIHGDRNVPAIPRNDYGVLRKGAVYLRRNTECVTADLEDIRRIVRWAEEQGERKGENAPVGLAAWEELYRECDAFDQRRVYIAVFEASPELTDDDWKFFVSLGWHLIVDFDRGTDTTGGYAKASVELAKKRSLRLTTLDEATYTAGVGSSMWVAALGLESRPSTIQSHTWKEWNQTKGRALLRCITEVARATDPQPVTALIFGGEYAYVQSVCDMLGQTFGDRLAIVFATPQVGTFADLIQKHDAPALSIKLVDVCVGLRDIQKLLPTTAELELPKKDGGSVVVPPERARWIEEEFEIVHLGAGISSADPRTELRDFLRGLAVTWYGLSVRVDIDRSMMPDLETHLRGELGSRDSRRVNLFHWPGAGGSTVARRVVWNLHNEFPALVARKIHPGNTTDRLQYIFNLTRLPSIVVAEASTVTSDDMDRVYDEVRSANIATVFLKVERRVQRPLGEGRHYLESALRTAEAAALAGKLGQEVPERRSTLERLVNEQDRRRRTPFYFGLVAFEKDFAGLEHYVQTRLESSTNLVLSVCRMVALAYHFAQQSLPIQLFADLLRLPQSKLVSIDALFTRDIQELFLQLPAGMIRPAHDLVAEEILVQLMGREQGNRLNWKNGLADSAIQLIGICATHSTQPRTAVAQVLRAIFVERPTEETPAGPWEGQFSALVAEIPTTEGKQRVFEELTNLLPEEPHFWAHLGRFYSRVLQDHTKAQEALRRAVDLAKNDPVIRHMAGMMWRNELFDILNSASVWSSDIESRIQTVVKEAGREFAETRRLDQRSEYNYISEIQMAERVIGVLARLKGFREDVLGFLSKRDNLWCQGLLDNAEELLSQLSRARAGEVPSKFQQDARSRLDKLYGEHAKAIQGWTNLLSEAGVYKPPVRRIIIRAYLSRRGRDWSKLTDRELSRISQLATDNLNEEPDLDQNLRLWFQAVRRTGEVSIERATEEIGYRRLRRPSVETLYYLYILKVIQAEMGVLAMASEAQDIIRECSRLAEALPHRTRAFEWLGKGTGWAALVHASSLGDWDHTKEFWADESLLRRVRGRISHIVTPGNGEIELPVGLKAFFVPSRGLVPGGYLRGQDIGREVEFYLGFSYDGLRAMRVSDVQQP